jgi:hypothetical protein
MAEHADEVADYTMKATLDPAAHTVKGEGTITWRNHSKTKVKELWVHLYLNAFKNEQSNFQRVPLGGFRGNYLRDHGQIDVRKFVLKEGDGERDLWAGAEIKRPGDEDETDVRVPLPREIMPGETITIEMVWDEKLPSVAERTGYEGSFHFVAQWFPKIARLEDDGAWAHFPFHHLGEFYADFGRYDVTIDVPESFVIGATGPLVEQRVEKGRRIERHVLGDIHDFAFTAWDKWQSIAETVEGVKVSVLYPPGFKVVAQREMAAMRFVIPHYNARYGKYPYPLLTVVHPPQAASEAGGMEYPTLITSGGPWYGPPSVYFPEIVTIHEYGHQYFYGLVATDEVKWPFLDEGVNSFAEDDAMSKWRGSANGADLMGLSIGAPAVRAAMSNRAAHNARVAQPAYEFKTGSDYGTLVYSRTATILETLRRVYGEALVMRALGRYARKYRFKHPVPDDLFAVFEEVVGARATATMKTALFEKGWVDYSASIMRSRKNGSQWEATVLVSRKGPLSFPVDVELLFADGSKKRERWDGEADATRIEYTGASALRSVVVDPDRAVLIDQDPTNNHATAPGMSGGGASRTLERALYWAELLVQGASP